MELKKSKNNFKPSKPKQQIKNKNNDNNISLLDSPLKMYEYQNRIHMMQRRINEKVKEERKNIEKQLKNFSTNYISLTTRNFYRDYKKFSDKYFKTTNLIDDIAYKYEQKGYIIPNLNHDFFKVNPLLDSNVNKLYISYLFNSKGEKIDINKTYEKNKGVKYITKLKNFISPDEEKDNLIKKKRYKSKNKKIKILLNQKRISNIPRQKSNSFLINLNLKTFKNKGDIKRKSNSSRNVDNYNFKRMLTERNANINMRYINSYNKENKKNSSKSLNSFSSSNKLLRNENRYHTQNKNKIISNDKKIRNSSNTLNSFKKNSIANNIKLSSKSNHLYINTEKMSTNKTSVYLNVTPKNKIQITSSNLDKSTNNTKHYSLTNNNEEINSSKKIYENPKIKEPPLSFKVKEFSLNSKSSKKPITIINNQSKKENIYQISSYSKKGIYPYIIKNKKDMIKVEKKIRKARISSSEKKKTYIIEEPINACVNIRHMYKKLKSGNYQNIENNIRNYLLHKKRMDINEVNSTIKKYDYKNLRANFYELNEFIEKQNLGKKIEKLYLNNLDFNRIEYLIDDLSKKEKEIFRFENKISKIYNKS